MKRLSVLVGLLLALAGSSVRAPAALGAPARESRIFYAGCWRDLVVDVCLDQSGKPTRHHGIMSILQDGTEKRQVTSGFTAIYPTWSSSGGHFAFSRTWDSSECAYPEMVKARSQGGSEEVLASKRDAYCDRATDWGDNGTILFESQMGRATEVHTIHRDGTHPRTLTDFVGKDLSAFALNPRWVRGGTQVLFWLRDDLHGRAGLFIMDRDGSDLHPFFTGRLSTSDWKDPFDVSPNGRLVAFSGRRFNRNLPQLFVSRVDGTHRSQLTRGVANLKAIRWSPTGSQILFSGGRPTNPRMRVVDRDGTEHSLDSPEMDLISSREPRGGYWSPNGRQVTFTARHPAESSLRAVAVVNADGSDPHLVSPYEEGLWVWGWELVPTG
jgi:Tol biopolymer transport system component